MTDRDLERRITELEWQLERYHEELEEAAQHNNDFQLGATWGLIRGTSFFVFLGSFWAIDKAWRAYIEPDPRWYAGIAIFFAAGFVWYHYTGYVERGFEGDKKKMRAWPRWSNLR